MKSYFQCLSLSSSLSSASGLLFFDSSRYLFNSGDCLQRVCNEHKIRFSKLKDIFITSVTVDTVSSLPGMMLSLTEIQSLPRRTIHGPPGLAAFIEASCSFAYNTHFDIIEYGQIDILCHPYRLTSTHIFQDENVKIHVLPFSPPPIDTIHLNEFQALPVIHNATCVYIVECKPIPKKFLPQKAKALGVPPGPLFGKLSNGESVNVNGKIITPEMVTEPSPPQPILVIFDVAFQEHCETVTRAVEKYLGQEFNLALFVHFTNKNILVSKDYLNMIARFNNAPNIVFDPIMANTKSIFQKSDQLLRELHQILPSVFSIPYPPTEKILPETINSLKNLVPNLIIPSFLTKFYFAIENKAKSIDRSEELKNESVNPLTESSPTGLPLVKSLSCSYAEIVDTEVEGSNPELLFLGTASMKPGTHRNVSCIHIADWGGGLILDCGEGSYSQLRRVFGEDTNSKLADLQGILISHLHADHHLGIIKILYERAKLVQSDLIVSAPETYKIYLSTCEKIFGPLRYTFQSLENIQIKGLTVKSVPVDHRIEAYGFVIDHASGWRIVYSGDTRPSPLLIKEGAKATVLIHEATLDDKLIEHAIAKFHSTLGEALQVASQMQVWKVVLTHFSQRYSKIPENTQIDAIYAFDLMKFKLDECTQVVEAMPSVLQLWKEEDENQ